MNTDKRKTLDDFPKFVVTGVWRDRKTGGGYTAYDLECTYDPTLNGDLEQIIANRRPKWFWLLIGERSCLCTSLKSLKKESSTAILTCHEKKEPRVIGQALAYLSPYWQAYNIWMVLDPNWGWQKKRFPEALGSQECQLCYRDIKPGEIGACDPKGAWMCAKCYERYVVPHDLAFVDEL